MTTNCLTALVIDASSRRIAVKENLAAEAYDIMPYTWETIPSYRLVISDVEDYLRNLFGNYKFSTEVRLHRTRSIDTSWSDSTVIARQ